MLQQKRANVILPANSSFLAVFELPNLGIPRNPGPKSGHTWPTQRKLQLRETALSRIVCSVDTYSTQQSAKVLGLSVRRVQQLAESGDLEGERTPRGYRLYQYSVHDYLAQHGSGNRGRTEATEPSTEARELQAKVEALQRDLGRLEGEIKARTQLSEVTESTLRDQLAREQERADRMEAEARELRDQLNAERSRGFWARLFGG